MKTVSWILAIIIAVLIIYLPLQFYLAWAASTLWGWFMIPLGLPAISILHMWGICLTLGVMRPRTIFIKKDDRPYDFRGTALTATLAPGISVAIGAIIKFWLMV